MASNFIHDRGRGPEIVGTRITVYNLLPDFLDETATEAYICKVYSLSPEQVTAARAYILNHLDTVLAEHLKIEARLAEGNPPEVIEKAKQTKVQFLKFKQWLAEQKQAESQHPVSEPGETQFPSFREWMAEQLTRTTQDS
jgi:uncharacterized protein (DUF433 family)